MTNEEAIEFLKIIDSRYPSSLESTFNDECERIALNMAIKALEERSQGEWIKDNEGNTICSNCGFECLYSEDGMLYSLGRYCHHCGAEMKGGAEND